VHLEIEIEIDTGKDRNRTMAITIPAMKRLQLVALSMVTFVVWGISGSGPFAAAFTILTTVTEDPGVNFEEEEVILHTIKKSESEPESSCQPSLYDPSILEDPCELDASLDKAPDRFSLVFPTQYGTFTAKCSRGRAPVWADRVYKLAKNGYYNSNYFFRVIPGRYTQFGTNGNPGISNAYNYTSTPNPGCSILDPQPPFMPYCMAKGIKSKNKIKHNCDGVSGLSNDFGTIAMSTSYKEGLEDYPNGVTWNATAELFINIGKDNGFLDSNLFVPICIIEKHEMEAVVLEFPSFGEVAELGGDGPSLGKLYEDGNAYIESNPDWKASMAVTGIVEVCP
jgi:cyclophilin family peptidyl-prolyl cis-trans isomerase